MGFITNYDCLFNAVFVFTDDKHLEELRVALAKPQVAKAKLLTPIDFEKDDDTNHHMEFIAAASNLRATNYDIAKADRLKVRLDFFLSRIKKTIYIFRRNKSLVALFQLLLRLPLPLLAWWFWSCTRYGSLTGSIVFYSNFYLDRRWRRKMQAGNIQEWFSEPRWAFLWIR